jgi:hypothetical protein
MQPFVTCVLVLAKLAVNTNAAFIVPSLRVIPGRRVLTNNKLDDVKAA